MTQQFTKQGDSVCYQYHHHHPALYSLGGDRCFVSGFKLNTRSFMCCSVWNNWYTWGFSPCPFSRWLRLNYSIEPHYAFLLLSRPVLSCPIHPKALVLNTTTLYTDHGNLSWLGTPVQVPTWNGRGGKQFPGWVTGSFNKINWFGNYWAIRNQYKCNCW